MADVRMIVSYGPGADFNDNWMSNTLYFAVDGGVGQDPDYQSLANDLRDIYALRTWTIGCKIEVRAYNMADAKPREERAYATSTRTGSQPDGAHQIALCLSYFSERNLPRQRGRIYVGPWAAPPKYPTSDNITALLDFGTALAGLGGLNVDWSVYSPTKAAAGQDPTMSISECWVDNSWDVQRRRKNDPTGRQIRVLNE